MPIALATDYLSQSIQLSHSLNSMLQAMADHPIVATPEQISLMKYMEVQLSKRHESCQRKLISRYCEGYNTVCNKLKNIDWGPWNAPTHLKTLNELEDCLGDLAITLQAIKENCSEHLTEDDVACITTNLSGLITKRQLIYNLVEKTVESWSTQSARTHICSKCWNKGGNSDCSRDSAAACIEPTEFTDEVSTDTDDEKLTSVDPINESSPHAILGDRSNIVKQYVPAYCQDS